jgi:hypothetical protein
MRHFPAVREKIQTGNAIFGKTRPATCSPRLLVKKISVNNFFS